MTWYIRNTDTKLILKTGTKQECINYYNDVYSNFGLCYEIVSDQQIKEESWEF